MSDQEHVKKCAAADAERAWSEMTDQEKGIVRFGMIPIRIHEEYGQSYPARIFSVALMNQAEKHGGMIA
jgi:hypothetical protein